MTSTTMHDGRVVLHNADCRDTLRAMDDNSIDSVVCDPPYALVSIVKRFGKPGSAPAKGNEAYQRASSGFMGATWDTGEVAFSDEFWAQVLRVLKPGGHIVAFSGTRTYHRMAVAIEDAGFEIRDQLAWVYGCLDDQTMAVTSRGVMPYHKINRGDLVLSYDPSYMTYEWQPVEEVLVYDVDDTVYRIATDFGDQVVSRNHRCIIERDGKETFQFAEEVAREREIRVPVLEDLRALLDAVSDTHKGASGAQQDVLDGVHESNNWNENESIGEAGGNAHWKKPSDVHGVQGRVLAEREASDEGSSASMLLRVQRNTARRGVEGPCAQGQGELEAGVGISSGGADDWRDESSVEGRGDLQESEGQLRIGSVRAVSAGLGADVPQGWIRDGASAECGDSHRQASDAVGVRASYRPRPTEQRIDQPDALCDEQGPQAVRAWGGHKTVVGRITPERYRGVIWCVRVKSGAFVAVRNGFAFPTGNSGFPKSHNQHGDWEGWGTALKPAWEPIALARKPLVGTVAANLALHGVGALNVDGCRVATAEDLNGGRYSDNKVGSDGSTYGAGINLRSSSDYSQPGGRWPANFLHDGSDEVIAAFPDAPGQQRAVGSEHGAKESKGVYGDFGPRETFEPRIELDKSASRFFYCAKASRADRDAGLDHLEKVAPMHGKGNTEGGLTVSNSKLPRANIHPTVKPTTLMQWLCRLITPPGGIVLDPFMGSGSTGKAAVLEGFQFVGIEREEEYMPIAVARVAWAVGAVSSAVPTTDPVAAQAQPVVAPVVAPANDNHDLFSSTPQATTQATRAA